MIFHVSYQVFHKDDEVITRDVSVEWEKAMNNLSDFDNFRNSIKQSILAKNQEWEKANTNIVLLSISRIIG